jgi:hypothetical protein
MHGPMNVKYVPNRWFIIRVTCIVTLRGKGVAKSTTVMLGTLIYEEFKLKREGRLV